MRALRSGFGALAFVLVATLAWAGAAGAEASGNSAATITSSFSDACRDFTAHASKVGSQHGKDISHVEIHHADGRVVKDETIGRPDYSLDGAAGGEIDFAIVKSGTTSERFDCVQQNSAPTALLEIKTPPVDQTIEHCFDFSFGGLACQHAAPRTDWTRATQIPDDGGSDSGLLHWICGALGESSPCSFSFAVSFRGTSSSDPDNDIASWSIDFGDGTSASGNWSADPPTEVSHDYPFGNCVGTDTFPFPSTCPITLTITDSAGQSDSDTIVMTALDLTPD